MIKRFIKINDNLYRGGAPTVHDVIGLNKHFGINKIVSLDEMAGKRINRITKLLGMKHIIIPLNVRDLSSLVQLLNFDLYDLLMKDGPTFIHCIEGKDRTGLVVAMFKCKFMHVPCNEAIEEAKKLGFGIGVPHNTIKYYEKAIKKYCGCKDEHSFVDDQNNADIVDNSRPDSDWRGSVLDAADLSSFAPYLDFNRQYPYNPVYNYKSDQSPTRNNFDLKNENNDVGKQHDVPLVGLYDNDAGVHGIGPVEPGVFSES